MTMLDQLTLASSGRMYELAVPSSCEFLVQRGLTARYNSSTGQISQVVPWAFYGTSEGSAADLLTPRSYSVERLEAWAEQKGGNCRTVGSNGAANGGDPIDAFMKVPLIGTAAVGDIQSAAIGS